ncbi:MAG: hypothetical protein KAU01_11350 [Candidatus Cloacimonetes bacterium]|nr:hypothetical protein [Candidatus Cloacimonadota bacterium]
MIKFIKLNIESIIAIILFSIIILLKSNSIIDERLFLGLLGAVATLYFGIVKFKIENDKLFKELFKEFNDKYDSRFNDLINELRNDNEKKLSLEERNLIIDYLNLCSEEYLWKSKNRIPNIVWNAWKAGIKENLKVKQVKEIYNREIATKNGEISFYGLVKELGKTSNCKKDNKNQNH